MSLLSGSNKMFSLIEASVELLTPGLRMSLHAARLHFDLSFEIPDRLVQRAQARIHLSLIILQTDVDSMKQLTGSKFTLN